MNPKPRRLLYNVSSPGLKLKPINYAIVDFDPYKLNLSIRWPINYPGDFFSNELHFGFAILDQLENHVIVFLVAERIGEPLNTLFCFFQTLE